MKTFLSNAGLVLRLQLIFYAIILLFTHCKKDIGSITDVTVPGEKATGGPIPPYLFDWETATYMPSNPANSIPMPWNSGTTAIDPTIAADHSYANGWRMVWSTFSPTTNINNPQVPLFLSLYNVYRGLLRFYLWQPPTAIATSYVNHGLNLYGNNVSSPMLNFNAQEIIRADQNQTAFAQVYKQPINANGGTWYVFQYEIAYDPNVAGTSFPNFGLTWASTYASVSNVYLNGSLNGTITGTIGAYPAFSQIDFNNTMGNAVITALGSANYLGLGGDYGKAVNNGIHYIVKDFLSGILGNGGQAVNLAINAKIKIEGSIVTSGGLENMKLILPGQTNSQTGDGNTPDYNSVLGVFNVIGKPMIRIDAVGHSIQTTEPNDGVTPCTEAWVDAKLWLDDQSINMIFNPAIINGTSTGATIQNLKKEILLFWDNPNYPEHIGTMFEYIEPLVNPTFANPGLTSYYTQFCSSEGRSPWTPEMAVRISFDVVPNNGAPPSKIVKTFRSNQFYD